MLTPKDLKNIINALKEVFYTKGELDEKFAQVAQDLSVLKTAMDIVLTTNHIEDMEKMTLGYRMKNAEDWIDKAAGKINIKFEH